MKSKCCLFPFWFNLAHWPLCRYRIQCCTSQIPLQSTRIYSYYSSHQRYCYLCSQPSAEFALSQSQLPWPRSGYITKEGAGKPIFNDWAMPDYKGLVSLARIRHKSEGPTHLQSSLRGWLKCCFRLNCGPTSPSAHSQLFP